MRLDLGSRQGRQRAGRHFGRLCFGLAWFSCWRGREKVGCGGRGKVRSVGSGEASRSGRDKKRSRIGRPCARLQSGLVMQTMLVRLKRESTEQVEHHARSTVKSIQSGKVKVKFVVRGQKFPGRQREIANKKK